MSRIAYIDGRYQPLNEPGIMVEDRGYQFSDGVYEVCAIRAGRLLDETAHLDRLDYSLRELSIPAPMTRPAMQLVMREIIRRNRVKEGILYLQVTRGVSPREHSYGEGLVPVLVMTVRPSAPARRAMVRENGIQVMSVADQRWSRRDIKSISLLPNVLARQNARQSGVQEAWQVDAQGLVTEGAATNAWIIDKKGKLRTRPASPDIFNGVVRQVIFELAKKLNIDVVEEPFSLDEAKAAQECFSTASTFSVFPVVSIDGQTIGNGKPGAVSSALAQAYDAITR